MDWVQAHLPLVLVVAAIAVLVLLVVGAALTWLNCRGKFMFLDGIVRNRGAVVEPWKDYRREGNSLFWFRLLFGLALLAVLLLAAGLAVAIAWPDIQARAFRASAVAALVVGILLLLGTALVSGVVNVFLLDFVVPIMYLRRLRVLAAWGVFRDSLLAGRAGTFVLYLLFKIVLGFGLGVLALLATCLTCCLAALPYLGSVILLPLLVFDRAYPLSFLEQFGPEWRFFPPAPALAEGAEGRAGDRERPGEGRPPDARFFGER
jgi:hypothetical protein